MIKITTMEDWGFLMRINTIKIKTMNLGPHFVTITMRRLQWKEESDPHSNA
jgi:hypothetical protein